MEVLVDDIGISDRDFRDRANLLRIRGAKPYAYSIKAPLDIIESIRPHKQYFLEKYQDVPIKEA